MTRLSIALLLLLAACSPEPAPVTAPKTAKPTPAPVDEVAQLPMRKSAAAPQPAPAPAPQPKKQAKDQDEAPAEIYLPAFTFRTMDHKEAKVELNGEPLSTTPCLWSISLKTKGDPGINLGPDWPPVGARFIATTKHPDDPESKADLYVIDKAEMLEKLGVGRAGECVLAYKGLIGKVAVQGALRLRVYNYRFTDFAPLDNPEGDNASRFLRTLWFERIDDR